MPRKPRDIEDKLKNKFGFAAAKAHSKDHRWYELRLDGLPILLTKISHSRAKIGPGLEAKIARQLRVAKSYLDGMIECRNSSDDYQRQVRDNLEA